MEGAAEMSSQKDIQKMKPQSDHEVVIDDSAEEEPFYRNGNDCGHEGLIEMESIIKSITVPHVQHEVGKAVDTLIEHGEDYRHVGQQDIEQLSVNYEVVIDTAEEGPFDKDFDTLACVKSPQNVSKHVTMAGERGNENENRKTVNSHSIEIPKQLDQTTVSVLEDKPVIETSAEPFNTDSESQIPECRVMIKCVFGNYHPCDICEKRFNSAEEIDEHKKVNHQASLMPTTDKDQTKPLEHFQNSACGKIVGPHNSLRKREKYKVRKRHCDECGLTFRYPYILEKHTEKVHIKKEKQGYTCAVCQEKFNLQKELCSHGKTTGHKVWGDVTYCCDKCGKILVSYDALRRHLKRHKLNPDYGSCFGSADFVNFVKDGISADVYRPMGNTTWSCHLCRLEFFLSDHLKNHLVKTHNTEVFLPFPCKFCDERFVTKEDLEHHKKAHINEHKKFNCDMCQKRYTRLYYLEKHKNIAHEGKKPYLCDLCGRSYTAKSCLKRHKQEHSGIKPFVCDVCGKGFVQKVVLHQHMNRHSVFRNGQFECVKCGKNFGSSYLLKKHLKKATTNGCPKGRGRMSPYDESCTDRKQFPCQVCGKVYYSFTGRYLHLRKNHQGGSNSRALCCSLCSKTFFTDVEKQHHETLHRNQKLTHHCKICNKWFRASNALQAHFKALVHLNRMAQQEKAGKMETTDSN